MKVLKFLVIYGRKASIDEIITPQELVIYALSWRDALFKAKKYEDGFFGLELRQIIKM